MRYIFILTILFSVFYSCSEDKLDTYDAERYVYFSNTSTDSIVESFFFYPGANSREVKIEIGYAGKEITGNCKYRIEVDQDLTTAAANDYSFSNDQVWEAGKDKDTLVLTLNKTPNLDNKRVRLVLKIVASDDFNVGPLANTRLIVNFTSMAITPTWWDERISSSYLGRYTETKYAEFIKATGISSMENMSASDKRYYSLKFKYYLINIKNETGKPVMDEGNVEMTVPVLG